MSVFLGRVACWIAGACDWKTYRDERGHLVAECKRCGSKLHFDLAGDP